MDNERWEMLPTPIEATTIHGETVEILTRPRRRAGRPESHGSWVRVRVRPPYPTCPSCQAREQMKVVDFLTGYDEHAVKIECGRCQFWTRWVESAPLVQVIHVSNLETSP